MKKSSFFVFAACLLLIFAGGCRKDIYGCTDPSAVNYNAAANISTNTCQYYGNAMFYTTTPNYGTITVYINGQSSTITTYVSSGTPTCGNTGSATFYLPVGVYQYTATAYNGTTWGVTQPQTATVTANGCSLYLLN